jgi:putative colanic acid biosynthesis acetyltransferase WcaF
MNLAQFSSREFDRGRAAVTELLWIVVRCIAFSPANPFNKLRILALKCFGAEIANGVVVKPGVKVKFPWRLKIGENSWIGEDVWIDNLDVVSVGANSCISQGAYLCTGNHDWKREGFDLKTAPISIGREVWIAAKAVLGPGVSVGDNSIVTMGAVVTKAIPSNTICSPGIVQVKRRVGRAASVGGTGDASTDE